MSLKIALAGNPNTGKTTLFNALTGSSQHVGNWPGVTVEKKEGLLRADKSVVVEDLPGIYSLSPYTLDEVVARNYLTKERPDAILNIVDASNLERNLYLTTQLLELGIPMVIALNMRDVLQSRGDRLDAGCLAESLGCPCIPISALRGDGIPAVVQTVLDAAHGKGTRMPHPIAFDAPIEWELASVAVILKGKIAPELERWASIKAFEQDWEALAEFKLGKEDMAKLKAVAEEAEKRLDDTGSVAITCGRYAFSERLVGRCLAIKAAGALTASDRIDRVVTNRWLALPIFVAVMGLVYYIAISTVGTMGTDWVNDVLFGEIVPRWLDTMQERLRLSAWLFSLVKDGIVAGVGSVLGFLPQMLVLFALLAILEDCGYMARIAFIMDRLFRRFGLSGKSFIPFMVGTGCGVPGVMSSRSIENINDRRLTVMTTTFMPCSAKLPIIALICGAVFDGSFWVAPAAYFIGIASIIVSGVMLKKTRLFAGDPSPFVIELPAYHWPGVMGVLRTVFERGMAFVKKAGSIILLATVLVWFLSSYDFRMRQVDEKESMLCTVSSVIAPVFAPTGFGDWRATAATITGLIAKENLVGTYRVLYQPPEDGTDGGQANEAGRTEETAALQPAESAVEEEPEDGSDYWEDFRRSYTPLAAFCLLIFNLLCAPCFAAIGAIHREMSSPRMTLFAVSYQCVFAYAVSMVVYQFGRLFGAERHFGFGTIAAAGLVVCAFYMLFFKKTFKAEEDR